MFQIYSLQWPDLICGPSPKVAQSRPVCKINLKFDALLDMSCRHAKRTPDIHVGFVSNVYLNRHTNQIA